MINWSGMINAFSWIEVGGESDNRGSSRGLAGGGGIQAASESTPYGSVPG